MMSNNINDVVHARLFYEQPKSITQHIHNVMEGILYLPSIQGGKYFKINQVSGGSPESVQERKSRITQSDHIKSVLKICFFTATLSLGYLIPLAAMWLERRCVKREIQPQEKISNVTKKIIESQEPLEKKNISISSKKSQEIDKPIAKMVDSENNQNIISQNLNVRDEKPEKTSESKQVLNRDKYVGTLGSQWKFDTDHRPIACSLQLGNNVSKNTINIASINICNTRYLNFIYKQNDQGLKGSSITTNDGIKNENGLTQREQNTVKYVKEMLEPQVNSNVLPRDIVCVQECSQNVYDALKKLPKHFAIISANRNGFEDSQLYIYNTKKLKITENGLQTVDFKNLNENNKKIVKIVFEDVKNNKFCLVGTHLPGGPKSDRAVSKLAGVLTKIIEENPKMPILVLGDMNAKTNKITQGINDAFDGASPFHPITKGTPTHVNTQKKSVDYDSIHGANCPNCFENQPDKILTGLKNTIDDLLN